MSLIALRMPKWGLSMTEGTLAAWHVAEGQAIERGAELCDIETAKITNAFEAPASGRIARLVAVPGEVVGVGRLIAVLATDGEDSAAVDALLRGEPAPDQPAHQAAAAAAMNVVETSAGPLAYADEGEGDPVVLLHGFGGDHTGWMLVQGALAARSRVIAFDLPGHGASTRSVGDGSAAALAAPLREAMAALCAGPVHLVAHSFGASVARALIEGGLEVSATSLIAPAGLGAPVDLGYVGGFAAARRKRELRPLMERLFAQPDRLGRDMVSAALAQLDDPEARASLQRISEQMAVAGPGGPDWPGTLRVIWGGRDRIISLPAAVADALGDRLDLLPDSGHLPQFEEAGRVASLLLAHLDAGAEAVGTGIA